MLNLVGWKNSKMGDKTKMKTGNLGANTMEEKELSKRLGRLKRQTDYFVTDLEVKQSLLTKRFLSQLCQSTKMAKEHEAMLENFESTRWNLAFQMERSEVTTTSKGSAEIRVNHSSSSTNKNGESQNKSTPQLCPLQVLKRMSQQFQVPYKKMYSFKTSEFRSPATVLDMRCKMWQRISFCSDKKDRAKSAPPWTGNHRAPSQIEMAHYRALNYVGIDANLVHPPSRQPQIDVDALKSYRDMETKVERKVVSSFAKSVEPFKIKPGPKQVVYDTSSLYALLAKAVK